MVVMRHRSPHLPRQPEPEAQRNESPSCGHIPRFTTISPLPPSYRTLAFSNYELHKYPFPTRTMSFLGGPECSTAGNPLTQFTKHVQNDNTLQRDRLVGRGPGGMEESMRSRVAPNGSDQV